MNDAAELSGRRGEMQNKYSAQMNFREKGFVFLDDFAPAFACRLATQYALLRAESATTVTGDDQVPGSHSVYGDPLVESLAELLRGDLEGVLGEPLWPTYGYYRLYKRGDKLLPHVDRISCEISLTVCLGYESPQGTGGEDRWPLWISSVGEHNSMEQKPADAVELSMEAGDAVLYKGCDVWHWREEFQGTWQAQAFLHYVRKNGPYGELAKYDGRPALGLPASTRDVTRLERMREVEAFRNWAALNKQK